MKKNIHIIILIVILLAVAYFVQPKNEFESYLDEIGYQPKLGATSDLGAKESYKDIYDYVYGEDLVNWQKLDGTEMCDGKNCIERWKAKYNRAVEKGERDKDVVKSLQGSIMNVKSKDTKTLKEFLGGLIKQVAAALDFNDTFTSASTVTVVGHTPDTGTGWSQILEPGDSCDLKISGNNNEVWAYISDGCGSGAGNNDGTLLEVTDTLTGADQTVKIQVIDNGAAADDANWLACRVQDANNMYVVRYTDSDADIYKRVSGTWSLIKAGSTGIADGSYVELICEGSTISVEDDGSEILTITDLSITAAGSAGFGMGDLGAVSGDDVYNQKVDSFSINSTGGVTDTCTYSGTGDWYIDASDNCYISSDVYVTGEVHLLAQ